MKYRSNIFTALTTLVLVVVLHFYGCTSQPTQQQNPSPIAPIQAVEQPQVSDQKANATVKIANFKYVPATVKIQVGQTVKFVNSDEEPHTVTSKDGEFNSKGLDTNQPWTYTFTKSGNFPYFCTIHPYMKGTVIVAARSGEK